MGKFMPTEKTKSEFAMAREGKVGKISIDGEIGWDYWDGMSFTGFKKQLAEMDDVGMIEVYINSPGGVITDGVAMANALREHPAIIHTYNRGMAASMGSVLLLAGDRVFIPDNAMTFIHKPLNMAIGNADDMRKQADELDKFEEAISNTYMKTFKGSRDELADLVAAETWHTADEIADKFDNVTIVATGEQQAAATCTPVEILGKVPDAEEDEPEISQGLMKKIVNLVRGEKRVGKHTKEVDMPITPEERAEIVEDVTASVKEGLAPAIAEAIEAVQAKGPDKPETDVVFEGDPEDAEAVQAHADRLAQAQRVAAVDWGNLESVLAYQKAQKAAADTPPPTNTSSNGKVLGNLSTKRSAEEEEDAVARMSKNV
jgi:ATP-dependent protease ClpP protease subunit